MFAALPLICLAAVNNGNVTADVVLCVHRQRKVTVDVVSVDREVLPWMLCP